MARRIKQGAAGPTAINAVLGPNGSMSGKVSVPGANGATPLPAIKKPAKPLVRKK